MNYVAPCASPAQKDEIRRLIDAVDDYEAYLHPQQRDEAKFGSCSCGLGKCEAIMRDWTWKRMEKLIGSTTVRLMCPGLSKAPMVETEDVRNYSTSKF
jgi:hypothetical protein